jgi:hypothetical protein
VVVYRDRQHFLRLFLTDDVVIKVVANLVRRRQRAALAVRRTSLISSRMMSLHKSTHSSQIYTDGPAISLRTSCWLLPQKEQYNNLPDPSLRLSVMSPNLF